jgi:hypothetical protein
VNCAAVKRNGVQIVTKWADKKKKIDNLIIHSPSSDVVGPAKELNVNVFEKARHTNLLSLAHEKASHRLTSTAGADERRYSLDRVPVVINRRFLRPYT